MSPASGDQEIKIPSDKWNQGSVSIQLMSPASGDEKGWLKIINGQIVVSIQLMSPASGD